MNPTKIIIIGSSAGGLRILKTLFTDLPRLNASIVLVQHMPKFINAAICKTLDQCTRMTVKIAQNGDQLEQGNVYIAPSEVHLALKDNQTIKLFTGEKVNFVCPSVDVTMKSLKEEVGVSFIGIILTGMGKDGAEGIRYMKNIGGITIAQDKESSIVYGMPREALATGAVDKVLKTDEIRDTLIELLGLS